MDHKNVRSKQTKMLGIQDTDSNFNKSKLKFTRQSGKARLGCPSVALGGCRRPYPSGDRVL